MAFPVVESTATSSEDSDTLTHTATMPSGIVSGDTLVAIAGIQERRVVTEVAGWTLVGQDFHDAGASVQLATVLLKRTADGTEGATEDIFTVDNACRSAHITFRISATSGVVENAGDASSVSPSTSPDPPSHTPSGGAADYLWLAMAATFGEIGDWTLPANYTNKLEAQSGVSTFDVDIAVGRRNLNASSEDPGTFTIDVSSDWMAWTISVAPEAGAAPSAPTGVTASNPTSTTIDLAWTDTNGGTANPRMYQRLSGTGPGNWTFVEQLAPTETTYTFTGLTSGTEYELGVSYAS